MSIKTLIKIFAITLTISLPTVAETFMQDRQQLMQVKISEMENLIGVIADTNRDKDVRAAMDKLSQVMAQTIQLSKDMVSAKERANEQCRRDRKLVMLLRERVRHEKR